jgi:hemin uptake protein HemP
MPTQLIAMMNDSSDKPAMEPPRAEAAHLPSSATDEVRTIRSEELFEGARVVLIQHANDIYRLLITRNDRLILQK